MDGSPPASSPDSPSRTALSLAALCAAALAAGAIASTLMFLIVRHWVGFLQLLVAVAVLAAGTAAYVTHRRREAEQRRKRLQELAHLGEVDAMTGAQFEETTADLLRRDAFHAVSIIGGSGDRGGDLTATAPDGRRVVVQCKRYKEDKKVTPREVRNLAGALQITYHDHVGVLVTSSDYTEQAQQEALGHLTLINREALAEWLNGKKLNL